MIYKGCFYDAMGKAGQLVSRNAIFKYFFTPAGLSDVFQGAFLQGKKQQGEFATSSILAENISKLGDLGKAIIN